MAAWADLATVFHWAPSELERLDWQDLARFHALAMERLELALSLKTALP